MSQSKHTRQPYVRFLFKELDLLISAMAAWFLFAPFAYLAGVAYKIHIKRQGFMPVDAFWMLFLAAGVILLLVSLRKLRKMFSAYFWVKGRLPVKMYPQRSDDFQVLQKWGMEELEQSGRSSNEQWQECRQAEIREKQAKDRLKEFAHSAVIRDEGDWDAYNARRKELNAEVQSLRATASNVRKKARKQHARYLDAWDALRYQGMTPAGIDPTVFRNALK